MTGSPRIPLVPAAVLLAGCGATAATGDTEAAEPVFVTISRDDDLQRYGRPPDQGWIPVPDTGTELRVTGFIRFGVIHDFEDAGFPYGSFIPAQIPVPTNETANTELDPRSSRLVFETRTNTDEAGYVLTAIALDVYGGAEALTTPNTTPRLREAYVTWVGARTPLSFTAGQTWSTFTSLEVEPETFDLQGPNATTGELQGIFRGAYAFGADQSTVVGLAIEQPMTAVQNGTGLESWPDLVARITWHPGWGRLQGAALARQLRAESTAGGGRDSALGYGLTLAGDIDVPGTERRGAPDDNLGSRQDTIQLQIVAGSGVGGYITDPGSAPLGQDAIYDDGAQELRPLRILGGFIGYHHWWTTMLRSQLVAGVVKIDNRALQGPDALDRTIYLLANVGYRLFDRMDVGIEYTWGERRNDDGQRGRANRLLFGLNFGF